MMAVVPVAYVLEREESKVVGTNKFDPVCEGCFLFAVRVLLTALDTVLSGFTYIDAKCVTGDGVGGVDDRERFRRVRGFMNAILSFVLLAQSVKLAFDGDKRFGVG